MILGKNLRRAVSVGISAMLFFTGCASDDSPDTGNEKEFNIDFGEIYTLSDADLETRTENGTDIVFSGEEVYLIEEPGTYRLTGECTGQLQIDVQDEMVHLVLQDVEMKSSNGPVIYVKSAAKVIITVPEGSSSILTDSGYYAEDTAKACIYSEDDLTINGSGSLQVNGYYKDAIRTKDTLKILGTNLTVQAKGDGLRGNDGVIIRTSALDIQCEGTGIYTEREGKENKGFVDMASGTVNIIAGEYGIDAAENVYIHNCQADIYGIVQNISCSGEQYIEEGCLE
mgnify:CR=1 FL=1